MDLKTKAIEKIARQLKILGCDYMIVPDGGAGKAIVNGNFTHHKRVKRGECTKHIASYAANLQPGETVIIPAGDYSLDTLQSAVSAYAFRAFGKGNYMSGRTPDETGIELLCLGQHEDTYEPTDEHVMREE